MKKITRANSLDSSDFEFGALIKVEDSNKNWGVSDLKPWPQLGDLILQEELASQGPLFQRSLVLAVEDLTARKNQICLMQNKPIQNNWLITDFKDIKSFKSRTGTIKIKCSNQLTSVILFLKQFVSSDVKLRLDFNGSLQISEFDSFLNSIPDEITKKIEYIEDPTAQIGNEWLEWNKKIPLAIDFADGNAFANDNFWSYFIIKPSRQDVQKIVTACQKLHKKFTITSSMDHAVGVAHGLRYAQRFAENSSGFLTLNLYEKTEFIDYFTMTGNEINFSTDAVLESGIGMTKSLKKLTWVAL